MQIIPLRDKLLIKRIEGSDTTKGGIIIPESVKEKPHTGKVLAISKGYTNPQGKRVTIEEIKVGDVVIFNQHAGIDLKVNDVEHTMLSASDVYGIQINDKKD